MNRESGSDAQCRPGLAGVTAGYLELSPIREDGFVFPVGQPFQLGDPVQVDDRGPADAGESLAAQPVFEAVHGFSPRQALRAHPDPGVVVVGLDPVDLGDLDDDDAFAGFGRQTWRRTWCLVGRSLRRKIGLPTNACAKVVTDRWIWLIPIHG